MRIRAPKDFWSGVMFCGFAAIALFAARGYSLGSAGRMGPGYFPLLLASLLGALGVVLIGRSILIGGEPVARFRALPLAVIATAICLFGVLIEPLGLIISLALLTLMSGLGRRAVSVNGNGRVDGRARLLLCRRFCLCARASAQCLAEHVEWT